MVVEMFLGKRRRRFRCPLGMMTAKARKLVMDIEPDLAGKAPKVGLGVARPVEVALEPKSEPAHQPKRLAFRESRNSQHLSRPRNNQNDVYKSLLPHANNCLNQAIIGQCVLVEASLEVAKLSHPKQRPTPVWKPGWQALR